MLQEFPAYTLETLYAADITQLLAILEYRRADLAISLFNDGPDGRARLAGRPDLLQILLEMARAQQGEAATLDDVYRDLEAQHPQESTDSHSAPALNG